MYGPSVIINRYIYREINSHLITAILTLSVIFFSYSFTRFMIDAASGLYKLNEVLTLTLYKLIIALEVLLPLSLYFAIIFGIANLGVRNELVVIRCSGMREIDICKSIITVCITVSIIAGLLSCFARPMAYNAIFKLKESAQASSGFERIKPGQFYDFDDGQRTVYIEGLKKETNQITGVFIRSKKESYLEIVSAPSGVLKLFETSDSHLLVLYNASVFRQRNNDKDIIAEFKHLEIRLKARVENENEYRAKSVETAKLFSSNDAFDSAELQWRLSTPITTLLLGILACFLTTNAPRKSRFNKLPLALAIYAAYYNLLGLSRSWVEQEFLSIIWWVPILTLTLAIAMKKFLWKN
jgi:lipopolysaccharide export system permease protein